MATNRVRIIVEGDEGDRGHVRLTDFLKQLDAVRHALKQTERLLRNDEKPNVYYRIVDVTHDSPLTVILEGVPEAGLPDKEYQKTFPPKVVSKFITSMSHIRKSGKIPDDFDYPAVEAYRDISTQHSHISSLTIGNGRRRVKVDNRFQEKMLEAIVPDETAEGSLTGTLDTVRLHNTTVFEIFPTVGPKKVACHFRPDIKEKVKQGLERYVRVYGLLRYKHWDKFPYAIEAREIEVYPEEHTLPQLSDIRGMAPDLTGGLALDEYLETVRHAWKT